MRKTLIAITFQIVLAVLLAGLFSARAQTEEFRTLVPVGALQLFSGTPPDPSSGWLVADGSCISRTTYADLFAVVGEVFDPCDASTTFGLPDMRGRVPVGAGAGTGLSARTLGQTFGEETHLQTIAEMPSHNHGPLSPFVNYFAIRLTGGIYGVNNGTAFSPMASTANTGGGQPFNVIQPSLVLNYLVWAGTVSLDIASDVVITVVVVFPTHTPTPTPTPTLTPTDGPSPTPTLTPSPTGVPAHITSYTVNGQEVVLDYTVTPGDAAMVGFLILITGLLILGAFHYVRRKIT